MEASYLNDLLDFAFCFSEADYVNFDEAVQRMTRAINEIIHEVTDKANLALSLTFCMVKPGKEFAILEKSTLMELTRLSEEIRNRFAQHVMMEKYECK